MIKNTMKTVKTLALMLLGATLVGCATGNSGNGADSDSDANKGLVLSVDKLFIYNNGGADADGIATFTVTYDGEDVTAQSEIFKGDEELLEGNTFTSTAKEACSFRFWASYGTEMTKSDIVLNVVLTPPDAPDAPKDTNPDKRNFVRRVLLTQFTGTGCGYCPQMMNALHTIAENSYYGNKLVLAAAHLYGTADPAYLNDAKQLDQILGVTGYPTVNADMWKNTGQRDAEKVGDLIQDALDRTTVKGGIAVNAEYHADSKYVVINTLVKASEEADFRIGAWLLEDKISGTQSNNGYTPIEGVDFNTHNNCIRLANKSRQPNGDYTGQTLGHLAEGETMAKSFAFPLLKSWKPENLRVIVFISTKEGDKWYINNVVKADIDGSVDFEYEEE